MHVLILGEIIGKIGRRAIAKAVPKLKKEFKPDFVLANVENLAHGKGVTLKTIKEILEAGVNFMTSGDHFWSKKEELTKVLFFDLPIIRPANYPDDYPGQGFKTIKVKNLGILIINLQGRVFMKETNLLCPFKRFNEILKKQKSKPKIILVDFHAEATAEKLAFFHYVNGRASVVFGTHTHIATADEQILSKGTAFITDIGMVGAKDSVIGFKIEEAIKRNLENNEIPLEIPEKGPAVINGIFVEVSERTGRAKMIKRIAKEVIL